MENTSIMQEGRHVIDTDTGLLEELNRFKKNISVYKTSQTYKDGASVYGIAFKYQPLKGKPERKDFTGRSKEELLDKRVRFLTDLYHKKQEQKKSYEQTLSELMSATATAPTVFAAVGPSASSTVPCRKTLSEAIDEFMAGYEPTVSGATFEAEKSNNNKIKTYLGKKLVTEITFNDYQNFINKASLGKDGVCAARNTILNLKISFNRIMRYCMKQKWISYEDFTLITTDIKIPACVREYNKDEKYLDYSKIGAVLRALKEAPKYYITARILLLTGMRQEEFYALEKSDLFREDRYININKAITKNKNHGKGERLFILGPTKNSQSSRKVPAIEEVFYWFDELERWMVKSGNRGNARARRNGELVITDRNGNLVDEHSFIVNLKRYLEHKPGINFTLGMARHCYQTYLDMLNAELHDVELAVGHKLNSVGDRYYRATTNAYLNRLYPYIEEMAANIEEAFKEK